MSKTLFIESLRRSYRNWQRKRNRVLPTEVPPPFFYTKDISAVKDYFSGFADERQQSRSGFSDGIEGHCFLCKEDVRFSLDMPGDGSPVNWRETLACPHCGLINRWRSCLHVFEAICEPAEDDRIYLTETLSPIFKNLSGRFPLLRSSEYFPDKTFGEVVPTHLMPVRNEDVTNLSFDDSSMDIVLSFDVLEHVPDYRAALREFYRVLDAGGQLVVSVPFSDKHETRVRASVDDDGHIRHLVEPCYHGDPLSDQGVLSYYDFGMELLDEMREAGFEECFLLCFNSKKWAYPGKNVVFIARKLTTGNNRYVNAKSAWYSARYHAQHITESLTEFSRYAIYSLEHFSKRVYGRLFYGRARPTPIPSRSPVNVIEVPDLPDIFHYWSTRYLVPEMSRHGFNGPEDFFFQYTKAYLKESINQRVNILSLSSEECDFEIRLTKKLLEWQLNDFVIECLDVNRDKLNVGKKAVEAAGLSQYFLFKHDDPDSWVSFKRHGIVYAHQALHRVSNLEGLFANVKQSLVPDGLFIISDMIGRNAHMQWPETVDALKPFWDELPKSYRYNNLLNRQEAQFINSDHSAREFGSLHSQDILPLLLEYFNFKFFFPYGNLVFVLFDRFFGHNFDTDVDWDRDFVGRVHARDEAGIINGELKPVSMLAVLTNRETETVLRHPALTPAHCLRSIPVEASSEP